MIGIKVNAKGTVTLIKYKYDGIGDFIIVDSILDDEIRDDYISSLHYSPERGFWYEYEPLPDIAIAPEPELEISRSEQINTLIRQRYSISEEFAIFRQKDTKVEEYQTYYDYAEECKESWERCFSRR